MNSGSLDSRSDSRRDPSHTTRPMPTRAIISGVHEPDQGTLDHVREAQRFHCARRHQVLTGQFIFRAERGWEASQSGRVLLSGCPSRYSAVRGVRCERWARAWSECEWLDQKRKTNPPQACVARSALRARGVPTHRAPRLISHDRRLERIRTMRARTMSARGMRAAGMRAIGNRHRGRSRAEKSQQLAATGVSTGWAAARSCGP
jgi:hypothetical protein